MKKTLSLLFAMLSLLLSLSSHAATYTWTGNGFFGQDFLWSNPNNWAELAAPQDDEQGVQLVFPNTGAPRATTNDVLNLVIKSVIFQGANYSIHGPGANGITMSLRGDNGGDFAVVTTAGGCQFGTSTRLQLASAGSVIVASGTTLTIKSRVLGLQGFSKTGPGTLSFQGLQANTFTGPLTVINGVVDFRGVGIAMPGSLIVGDGNALYSPIARLYLNDQIGDASPVTVNANGTLELDGHNDAIGALTLAGGAAITTIEGGVTGTLTLNGNVTNKVGVAGEGSTITGKLSLGSTTRGFHVEADTELRIDADISGVTAGLTKSGPGQLTLRGAANTYVGQTTVQAGALLLDGAEPGSADNGTIVASGARLMLWNVNVGAESLALAGTTNAPALQFAGTNFWAGNTTVSGHCLLKSFPSGGYENKLTLSGNISGAGALHLTDWSDVYFTGFGNNTFTGGYYGEEGRTHFAKSASAQSIGGPLFVGRAEDPFPRAHVIVETLNQIPNHLPVTVRNSGALTGDANDTLGDLVIEGGFVMSGSGSFTLSGSVTNRIGTNDSSGIYGDTFLTAGEHIFHGDELSILNVYGPLNGAGGITMQGGGMMVLHNTNSYAGLTHVADGTLRLTGRGRPGSSAAGTVVDGLAWLQLRGVSVTNEVLQLDPLSTYAPVVSVFSTNFWRGPVVLHADADIRTFGNSHLTIDGVISGSGGILYRGDDWNALDGTLELAGVSDNTYQGTTTILEGTLLLNKLGRAIPNSLTIGSATNGADFASVHCLRPGQLTPATDAAQMNTWNLTVNPAGGFHCNGFDQTAPGIRTRGGGVFTDGATLSLQQGWRVEPDSGTSRFFGTLRLNSLFNNFTHIVNVETNSDLLVWGDIGQAAFTAHVEKQGKGTLAMISSNSFNGNLTLSEGVTHATGAQPYGTVNGYTRVDYDATLITLSGTNAEPFILTGSGFQNQGALIVQGSNYFTGPITLGYNADIVTPGSTNLAVFTGAIGGPGGITKLGNGRLILAGNADNTYAGATKANEGALELTKTNATAIRGALEIAVGGSNGLVRYLRDDQLHDLAPVNIGADGQLRLLGHTDTIGSLRGAGIVELLGGSLITGNDNTATTYAGVISGIGGNLTKTGTNTFTLAGDNAYTGTTFVKGGTLLVRGQQPQSDVAIQTGGTLGGNGTVGSISDLSGHVKPGVNTYGVLKCGGFLTHAPGNVFQIEINGTTPGLDYDQLDVAGGVTLLGGTLQIAMNFTGAVSNEYVIVRNDGSDPVTGTFVALPQGGPIAANGVAFEINYHGGDGNDIVLIQKNLATGGPQLGGVKKLNDGTIEISGTGLPNTTWSVEATVDLNEPIEWTKIGTTTYNAQGQFTFTDPDAPQHSIRFYRFVTE